MSDISGGFIALFERAVRSDPGRPFARFSGAPITTADLHRQSSSIARWLRAEGVGRGDRVALMIRNSPAALALLFGLAKAGGVWVPINVRQRGEGLAHILSHSAPKLLVADHELVDTIRASGAAVDWARIWTLGAAEGIRGVENVLARDLPFAEPPPEADAPFAIMYTSGTTGRAKGAIVSHRMLRLAGEAVALVTAPRDGDVMFLWEPLYHIGGAQMIVLPLIRDVSLALVERFSARRFWQEVRANGATHIHYLGGILQLLLKQPPGPLDQQHGARIAWGGGCPRDIWTEFEQRFGIEIRECYGMTEASSITTYNDRRVVGSVGRPVPWFAIDLLDGKRRPVPLGARGEIVVRTSLAGAITPGYFNSPEETAKALRNDALHTSDVGSFDAEGNLFFHGRMTDNVRVKGENVSAFEVESVAAKHPAVEDCAMIGVASDIGDQDIKLFVKPKPGCKLGPAALSAWLEERLAPYQNPRYIQVVDEFERTPSQRIMKHKLSRRLDDCWDRLKRNP
jgi:crotonobetaine/carnitine-CoA ligase